MRVGEHIGDKYGLSQVSRSATRSDVGADAYAVRCGSVHIGEAWGRGTSQVHTVLVKKENRAQHSLSVSLYQKSDTRQDIVERRADEDHLERVEHRLAGQNVSADGQCCRRLILEGG